MRFDVSSLRGACELAVTFGWLSLLVLFRIGRAPAGGAERRRDPISIAGMVLQGVGFFLAWSQRRTAAAVATPLDAMREIGGVIVLVLSIAIVYAAFRHLGKQWSLTARVLEEHSLVTTGPYRFVRHPIYSAMLGMLIGTGLVIATGWALLAAVLVYLLGTLVRVRSEEKLLRANFGAAFDAYAAAVPALVPRL